MNSRIVFTGNWGWTTTESSPAASCTTGAKLFTGSYGSLGLNAGVMPKAVAVNNKVWPSGAVFATSSAPMLPVAPARLSVITPTFQRSASLGPSVRARMSAPVPGVNGTMIWTLRCGKATPPCAPTAEPQHAATSPARHGARRMPGALMHVMWDSSNDGSFLRRDSEGPIMQKIDTGQQPCEASTMNQNWVVNEPEAMRFQVNRATLVDPQILELEQRRIYDVC